MDGCLDWNSAIGMRAAAHRQHGDPVHAFANAMREAGIPPPDSIVSDGKMHRFRISDERRGKRSGWYVLHLDGPPAGAFGDWRNGEQHKWCVVDREARSEEEERIFRVRMEEARRQREAAQATEREKAATTAARVWENAKPADPSHPYLVKKRVKALGLRQTGTRLVVSVQTPQGELAGLQFILPDGAKRFLPGTPKRGNFYTIGGPPNGRVVICEGFATGATLQEALGASVVVAFDAGNLLPVAKAIREAHPQARIIIAGDNDRETEGNPGVTKATAAAEVVAGEVIIPEFKDGEAGTDWNDYAALHGLEAVKAAFETAPALTVTAPPLDWRTLELPARRFALGHAWPLGCASLLHSLGGGGKSMLLLTGFVSLAIGRTLIPAWPVKATGKTLYLSLEDDLEELYRRLQRIAFEFELTAHECNLVADRLKFLTLVNGADFFRRGPGNSIMEGPHFAELRRVLEAEAPVTVLALDPKSALLGGALDENDNPTAQKCMNLLTAATGPDTAMVIADHVAKTDRDTSTSARGAGAWGDAARQVWAMRPINAKEQKDAGPGYDPALLVALELRKTNYTGPMPIQYLARRCHPQAAGVLAPLGLEQARQQVEAQAAAMMAEKLAEVIGANEGNITQSDLLKRRKKARPIVDAMTELEGRDVKWKEIDEALRHAIGHEILLLEVTKDGTIPRAHGHVGKCGQE